MAADHDHEYFALHIDRLGRILLVARWAGFHFSALVGRAPNTYQANTSQAMVAGERISDQARHTAMLDLAMDEPVRQLPLNRVGSG
jgi:hypothetical protein